MREGGAQGGTRGGRGGARGAARGASAREAARPRSGAAARRDTQGGTSRQARARQDAADERYDLLTAALIGAAVGATAMFLVRRPAKRQLLGSLSDLNMGKAGRMALKAGASRVGTLRDAGRAAAPMMRDAAENLGDYVRTARSAIDEFLADEVRDIKKAIRRGRRRAGL